RKRILDIWNSNDLISWEQKYHDISQPFRVLRINTDQQENDIDKRFLIDNVQKKAKNTKFQERKFEIKIVKDTKNVFIELVSYLVPDLNLINDKLKTNIKIYSDWVDSWAIDFNRESDYFNTNWISFRTPKNRKLKLTSIPYTYKEQGKYIIAVKVNDILGIETTQEYEIDIE
ncbi:MAG: hypothetical protein ACFE8G_11070, partial [Candidatus Hermodarchaeota archaeon]